MTERKPYHRSSSGWSDERRARHSAAIRAWSPWTHSTGPRTDAGKSISRCNALKHGATSRPVKHFMHSLRVYRQFLALCFERRKSLAGRHGQTQPTQFRGEQYRPQIHQNLQNELLNKHRTSTRYARPNPSFCPSFPHSYIVHFCPSPCFRSHSPQNHEVFTLNTMFFM